MRSSMLAGGLLTTLAMVLAGCSGNFDVQQTEPFRVQLEGEPQTVSVDEADSSGKEVVVVTCGDCDDQGGCNDPCSDAPKEVTVKVQVQPKAATACVVKVIIKDKATGEVLQEGEVGGGGSSTGTTTSSGNTTVTETQTETQTVTQGSTQLVQNFVVNVKGNHNIVVLTQAIQGSASVAVSAAHASGQGTANAGSSVGSSSTMTASDTSSTTTTY